MAEETQLNPGEYKDYYNSIVDLYRRNLFDYEQAYNRLIDVLIDLGHSGEAANAQVKRTLREARGGRRRE